MDSHRKRGGVYPGVHFEATDGTQTVSEDTTITVAEASLSISGTVTLSGGGPASGIVLRVGGLRSWTAVTDAEGRFRIEDLAPHHYSLQLDRASHKQYTASPGTTAVVLGSADISNVSIVVSPR